MAKKMNVNDVKERVSFISKVQYKNLKLQMMWCYGFLVAMVDNRIITNQEYEEVVAELHAIFKDRQERKA